MNKEQEIKLEKAIAKMIGYKVGDKVIITSTFTGRTVFKDGVGGEYSWDVECVGNLNKIGVIETISENAIPTAYRLRVDEGYSYTYIPNNFRLFLGKHE